MFFTISSRLDFKMKITLFCVFLILFGFTIVKLDGLKVLTIAPFSSKSHFTIAYAISKSLLDAGHEITMLSPYPLKKGVKNYTDISVAETMENLEKGNDSYSAN